MQETASWSIREWLLLVAFAVLFAGGLLLATADGAGAVESHVQACVSKHTGVVRVAHECQPHEYWLALDGHFNPPEPPARPER